MPRISGQVLRTPIVLHPSAGDTGDGVTYGTDRKVNAEVKRRTTIVSDVTGATLVVWAVAKIRPTVTVQIGEGVDAVRRPPAAGDQATISGVRRTIASVEPVNGPGTAIAYLELVAGDG